ncbi:MarR family winged helix-turn-helix transcriptional regulator [Streptomyces sp. NBC_00878]|uniref:MarR family winged helix-turn-helix transcriptional regulator n=1 Tax=Streptomyces sp. NBC_00878 TaxID=2975854 RepID=UPI00225AE14C|nr:MarR family winged helix-turn-helix transcriptional regulator [Streptomyces sp. NBC_00878]MCX4906574.1 MarR family winged helix-turn-helix transcriptional regulator [Streptomyces sp. NBC_00878]
MDATDHHQPDTPRGGWLDEQERDAWLGVAALILKLPTALDGQLQQAVGVNLFEYIVMARLSEHPSRRMRMSDLATLVNGSRSRLSHTVRRLSTRGYMERHPDPEDGRYTDAFLTEAGYDLVVRAAPAHVAMVRHVLIDAVSPDQLLQLADIGQRVVARIDPGGSWPP